MTTIYVKTTCHDLSPDITVSIYSTPQVRRTPEATVAYLNKVAKSRAINATYELSTYDEYWAHRVALRRQIEAGIDKP